MFALVVIAISALCLAVAQPAIASDEEDVLKVMEDWTKALNTADFELMSSLYYHSEELSQFPPVEGFPFLMKGWDSLEKWWKTYLGFPEGTFVSTSHNQQATILSDNLALITGYQTLVVNPPVFKEQTVVQSRQTTVVQKIGGKWLIVHDHGSNLPTE